MLEVRAIAELGAFFSMAPLLRLAPRGDGHPVLVLPGLVASDVSTRPLRAFLIDRGYRAHGWKLGRNLGPRPGVEDAMRARLALPSSGSGSVSLWRVSCRPPCWRAWSSCV